jgi:hypothetical protein
MVFLGMLAGPLAVAFAILAVYWWFRYTVLEEAIQRALTPATNDGRGGCLVPFLVLAALATLLLLFLLEAGAVW